MEEEKPETRMRKSRKPKTFSVVALEDGTMKQGNVTSKSWSGSGLTSSMKMKHPILSPHGAGFQPTPEGMPKHTPEVR